MRWYQRKIELENARSHGYFHFIASDFLHDNRSLGMYWKMVQNCAVTSVKVSKDENSYLRGRKKKACHSGS